MKKRFVFLLVLLQSILAHGINDSIKTEADPWSEWVASMAEEGKDASELMERIQELQASPIPLNNAGREQLESIPLLSEEQIENLAYYLYRYGPMMSLSELMLIDGLDENTIRLIMPLVSLGTYERGTSVKPLSKQMWKYGKQELRITVGRTFQKPIGYSDEMEPSKSYTGDPAGLNLKYGFDYKQRFQFGVVLDKDPGESVWNRKSGGIDQSSFHLALKDFHRIRNLVLGDYKLRFGQGLICNQGFSIAGESPELSGSTVNRHFSASGTQYFRGITTRYLLKKASDNANRFFSQTEVELILFASWKKIDTNASSGSFSSILTDQFHRTETELNHRKNVLQSDFGVHLQASNRLGQAGFTIIENRFDTYRMPPTSYRYLKHPAGYRTNNLSIDGKTAWRGVRLFGELAFDQSFHHAWLLGMSIKPVKRTIIQLLGRNYTPDFYSEFGNAFGAGSRVCNEQGMYLSVNLHPIAGFVLYTTCDYFRFPSLSFYADSPTNGFRISFEADLASGKNDRTTLRYKHSRSEQNVLPEGQHIHTPIECNKDQIRLTHIQQNSRWTFKSTIETNRYEDLLQTYGWGFSQDIGFEPTNRIGIYGHLAYFQSDRIENSIYLYEKGFPGSFSIPALYGDGLKQSLYASYTFQQICLRIKLEDYWLPNRKTIGDGLEERAGNRRSFWYLQCTCKW